VTRLAVIGLLGNARSGKDTAGTIMAEARKGVTLAFVYKLKQVCSELFDVPLNYFYDERLKAEGIPDLPCMTCPRCGSLQVNTDPMDNKKKDVAQCRLCFAIGETRVFQKNWTPRMILQHVGTEGFRAVDPKIWTRHTLAKAAQLLQGDKKKGRSGGTIPRFAVITDVRLKNEVDAIQAAGGEVWRIVRPGFDGTSIGGVSRHSTEVEQQDIPDSYVQATIVNDGTIDALKAKLMGPLDRFLRRDE